MTSVAGIVSFGTRPSTSQKIGLDVFYVPWVVFVVWVALSSFWGIHTGGEAPNLATHGLFIILFLLSIFFSCSWMRSCSSVPS